MMTRVVQNLKRVGCATTMNLGLDYDEISLLAPPQLATLQRNLSATAQSHTTYH